MVAQLASHIEKEKVRPPIHRPEMESSTPKNLERPSPAPIANVQTGQMARAEEGKRKKKRGTKAVIFNIFFIFKGISNNR